MPTSLLRWLALLSLLGGVALPASARDRVNPFGDRRWIRFGNLPISPNGDGVEFGYALHLMAVDLYQAAGTPVYSVQSGVPSLPHENDHYPWATTVQVTGADGQMSYYMHLDPRSIPEEIKEKSRAGISIARGTLLGNLILWRGMSPHLHFGMADCRRGVRVSPLGFLDYSDHEPPVIEGILAEPQSHSSPPILSGAVNLIAKIRDSIDGMKSAYPPNRVELEIVPDAETPAPPEASFYSVLFDASEMPRRPASGSECDFFAYDSYSPRLGAAMYLPGGGWIWSGKRAFPIRLTVDHPEWLGEFASWLHPYPGPWRTDACDDQGRRIYPNGKYWVRVWAFDAAGNSASAEQPFLVQNPGCER